MPWFWVASDFLSSFRICFGETSIVRRCRGDTALPRVFKTIVTVNNHMEIYSIHKHPFIMYIHMHIFPCTCFVSVQVIWYYWHALISCWIPSWYCPIHKFRCSLSLSNIIIPEEVVCLFIFTWADDWFIRRPRLIGRKVYKLQATWTRAYYPEMLISISVFILFLCWFFWDFTHFCFTSWSHLQCFSNADIDGALHQQTRSSIHIQRWCCWWEEARIRYDDIQ